MKLRFLAAFFAAGLSLYTQAGCLSTSFGDPSQPNDPKNPSANSLSLNLEDADFLMLTSDKKQNLKKISNDQIEEVLGGDTEIKQLFIGPQGQLVFIAGGYSGCNFFILQPGEKQPSCIEKNIYSVSDTLQFDAKGNVYFQQYSMDYPKRWDATTGEVKALGTENNWVRHFYVHPEGSVWIQGNWWPEENIRRIKLDGSLEELPLEIHGDFTWIDEHHALMAGENIQDGTEGIMLVTFNSDKIEKIDVFTLPSIYLYDAWNFQKADNGHIYAMARSSDNRHIIDIYPNAPKELLVRNEDLLRNFKVFGDSVYYMGKNPIDFNGYYLLKRVPIDDPSTEIDLLNGDNIEVYRFTVRNNEAYFDGLRFSDNQYLVGKIDQSNGNELTVIGKLDGKLLDFIDLLQ